MEVRKIKRNKPRIALLIDTWFPVHTGEQVYSAKLAAALASEYGYEVDILTRALSGKSPEEQMDFEKNPGIRVRKFGWKSHPWNVLMQLGYVAWMFFYLLFKGKSYRLYHAHTATSAFAMKAASWFTRVPTLTTVHASHVFQKTWTLKKIVHRVMFLETKYTQEVSISESFLKAINVNEPVLVVPYGVDTAPFDDVEARKSPEQFNVLFVGKLDLQKGVDVLLKAVKKVIESTGFIQSHKDFMLHLAGEGPDRKYFENLSEKLGIQKYVRLHGMVSGMDLIHLYKSCDLFVLPSRVDALPQAVLEASAARLPILGTHVGDMRNVVLENVNGHLVEPDDVDDLAYYLELYASNPHLEALGQGGYDLVSQEFSWEKSVQKMLRIYESLMVEKRVKAVRKHDHFMPWQIPALFWKAGDRYKQYKGKAPLRFCLTLTLSHPFKTDELPEDNSELSAFLERFSEFTEQLEIPSTIFVQSDLLEPFATPLKALQKKGHELGIKTVESEWLTSPMRRSTLRSIREQVKELDFKKVHMLHPPLDVSQQDLEILHEAQFESLPVSEDPWPHVEFHHGIPYGHMNRMSLRRFLELNDEELLAAVNRLRAYQKKNGLEPFLIFECDNLEFSSRDDLDYASGENFTLLSRKLAFLKEQMELQFMTLSDFCKSCSA